MGGGRGDAADKANQENIDQAKQRMTRASAFFDDEETKKRYAEFVELFAQWVEKSSKVIDNSRTPSKLMFARKSSHGGSAFKLFNEMREMIDQLQGLQQKNIQVAYSEI